MFCYQRGCVLAVPHFSIIIQIYAYFHQKHLLSQNGGTLFLSVLTLVEIQDEGNEAASTDSNARSKTKPQYEFMLNRDTGTETFSFLNYLILIKAINLKNLPNMSLQVFKCILPSPYWRLSPLESLFNFYHHSILNSFWKGKTVSFTLLHQQLSENKIFCELKKKEFSSWWFKNRLFHLLKERTAKLEFLMEAVHNLN